MNQSWKIGAYLLYNLAVRNNIKYGGIYNKSGIGAQLVLSKEDDDIESGINAFLEESGQVDPNQQTEEKEKDEEQEHRS